MKRNVKFAAIGLTCIALGATALFGFTAPPLEEAEYCCCAYKYQITNPSAPTYYQWMQVKTCRKVFAGSCSGKSKANCN